jgi:hypothetical protein
MLLFSIYVSVSGGVHIFSEDVVAQDIFHSEKGGAQRKGGL